MCDYDTHESQTIKNVCNSTKKLCVIVEDDSVLENTNGEINCFNASDETKFDTSIMAKKIEKDYVRLVKL